eukprot:6562039-Alexandrium_andersonii.AAC.1
MGLPRSAPTGLPSSQGARKARHAPARRALANVRRRQRAGQLRQRDDLVRRQGRRRGSPAR